MSTAKNQSLISRRAILPLAGAAIVGGYASIKLGEKPPPPHPAWNSSVTIVRASSYSKDLEKLILEGVKQCGLNVKGKRVLLKPNLVEFDPDTCVNTNVAVIAAAYGAFRSLDAASVIIAEGPGHRRDTYGVAEQARYRSEITDFDKLFVDLNRDDVSAVKGFADLGQIYLPNTALGADLIVSLPKMKTHHWAGATLSMKNFFGLVPGSIYGWPKNQLHYVGIPRSIVELNRIFHNSFAIVDAIVGMEGNGPIQGTPKHTGALVMGGDLVAVDATCCRIMGIDPEKIEYLRGAAPLGNSEVRKIQQRGELIASVRSDYELIKDYKNLRLA